jgi:hypothetical protein
MIRNVLSALFALIIAIGLAGCGSGDSQNADTVDVTQHDNWVYLEPWQWNPTLAYAQDDHSITSGQPWGGVSTGQPDLDWGIDVKAGRKGSSSPAAWFRSHASAATCTADCNTDWPADLNFAIKGTITIDGHGYPVTIGQGSTFGKNNWWIGGPGWTAHPGVFDNVVTPDGKYVFMPVDNTTDQFWIKTSYSSESQSD